MLIYHVCVCCSSEWPVIGVTEAAPAGSRPLLPTRDWLLALCCSLWQPHTIFRNLTKFLLPCDPIDSLTLGKHNS